MTDAELDRAYAAVRQALGQMAPKQTEFFLSMLCLGLMARFPSAEQVLPLVETIRAQCDAEALA